MHLLAYRPFLDPIELHELWFVLIVPLALLLSLAYKAVRVPDLAMLPRQVAIMTIQICFWMAMLGLATYLFVQYLAPVIAPR